MKRLIALIGVIICMLSIGIAVNANGIPTATVNATLVGEGAPIVGEKFTVAINIEDISSNVFTSGEVLIEWPENVVSLVDYYEE